MVIEAYTGFAKKPNSTKRPSGAGTQITVRLKDNTSVLNPHFRLKGYNFAHNYIKWGSRYYFVDDIISISENEAEYVCSTDVLATYKDDIGASSQYILRSSATFDGTVSDAFYPMTALKDSQVSTQANGFIFPFSGTFVFGIQGKSNSGSFGSTTYYCMDVFNAQGLMDDIFNANNSEYDAASVEAATGLPEKVYQSIINPQQYIVSCMYLPFEYETIGSKSTSNIMLGWYEFSGEALIFDPSFDALPYVEHTFTLPKHPQNARGNYMNNAPFTEYVLSFMPFGEIPLPADLLVSATNIYCKCIVDVITGQGTLKVYSGTSASGQLIASSSAQIGVPIAVSGGVYDTSIGGTVSKAVKGGIVGAALGALSGNNFFEGITDGIAQSEQAPTISTSGSNGALDFLEYDCKLYSRFTHVTADDNAQHGRPLCAVRTIQNIPGFIMCLKPDLDFAASPTEKDMVVNFMQGGFYYE